MNRGLRLLGLRMFVPDKGMTILDIGCGTGVHLEIYQKYGCNLYGIDTSASMLEVARARLREDADLRLADAAQMPYETGVFDFVLCMLVLHETDHNDRGRLIGEIKRVIKEDGRILLIDFHTGNPRSLKGWLTKLVILISEVAAGRRHYQNYRHFMSIGGLPALIMNSHFSIEMKKIVAGNTMDLYLLNTN